MRSDDDVTHIDVEQIAEVTRSDADIRNLFEPEAMAGEAEWRVLLQTEADGHVVQGHLQVKVDRYRLCTAPTEQENSSMITTQVEGT